MTALRDRALEASETIADVGPLWLTRLLERDPR